MHIVFLILVLYGLFFFLLAMTDEGVDRRRSKADSDPRLAAPISLSTRNSESAELPETTELAI